MPLNADHLRTLSLPPQETVLTDRDVMFYALSIGLGRDPLAAAELPYVYEKDLRAFATMPLVIGHPGAWMDDLATGVTRARVVHGAQRLWVFGDLPVGRPLLSRNRIAELQDKGDKGAVIVVERETRDKQTGALLARGESSIFCRADGGFGGASAGSYEFAPTPAREPDRVVDMPTEPNAALVYRLNHDRNPLHADPDAARRAGFDRPILHGLCTFGLAAVAATRAFGGSITAIEARFSKPVTPGDTIKVDLWEEDGGAAFRARGGAGDNVVLDRGRVRLA